MGSGIPFDAQAKRRIIASLKRGRSLAYAAAECGFTTQTVKRHIANDREFEHEVYDAIQYADGKVQATFYDKMLDPEAPNLKAMQWWLETRQPAEFGQKKLIVNQHVGPGGGPIQVAVASTESLRELLTGEDTREKMLALTKSLPVIEASASEHE